MKKTILTVTILIQAGLSAQWTDSGSNTTTTDNVGIGTTSPEAKLKVVRGGTIGGIWNPNNSFFTLSDGGVQSLIMDSNEIYGSSTLHIGSYSGDLVRFRTVLDSGAAIDRMIIKNNGYVGMGTLSPSAQLHVSSATSGDAILLLEADTDNNNESDNPEINFSQDGGLVNYFIGIEGQANTKSSGTHHNAFIVGSEQNRDIQFVTNDQVEMTIKSTGVGIGTITPDAKLTVKGDIHTQEVKVDLNGAVAPDYVFEADYDLQSLEQVQNYIQQYGHLPNIPSAQEMEENGLLLKEMNLKLLEKVEELTLYIIEQEKRIQRQEIRMRKIEQHVKDNQKN